MYSEFITDIGILCEKAELSQDEKDAFNAFSSKFCDSFTSQIPIDLLVSAINKVTKQGLLKEYFEYMATPKSWNADFDGENGISL